VSPPFRKLGEQEVWAGSVISLATGRFETPDGVTFERELVHHPGAVSVVPVDGRRAVLVRQYRAAVGRELLEIPAGKRDVDGEELEATAQRELAEEIGYRAGRLEKLAEFYNSVGFSDELSHVFLGTELEPATRDVQGPEEAHMTIERIALDDVPRLIAERELIDAKTIIGLLLARERLA
jgi:ADP-ribose pyrophosphatase